MSRLIIQHGDIWTTTARAIGHGVNVDGKMGAGIAVQFRERFPAMYDEYVRQCEDGTLEPGEIFAWEANKKPPQFIYNIASQDRPGPHAQIDWLRRGVALAQDHAVKHHIPMIALPMIGAGIGGLEPSEVVQVLKGRASYHVVDIELWMYNPEAK